MPVAQEDLVRGGGLACAARGAYGQIHLLVIVEALTELFILL